MTVLRWRWMISGVVISSLLVVEDQAMHVVGQIGQRDLSLCALDADGADEQAHLVFLPGKEMLDAGADLGLGGVGLRGALGHPLPLALDEGLDLVSVWVCEVASHIPSNIPIRPPRLLSQGFATWNARHAQVQPGS